MAGEAFYTDLAIKLGAGIAYGAGLIVYVKMMLKSHSKELEKHEEAISDLRKSQSLGVRPEDIKVLRADIRELRQLIMNGKE